MLKKIGIEKVVFLLPEVGDPVLAKARKIEELNAQVAELQKRIEEQRQELNESVTGTWTIREIQKATKQAVQASR